MINWFDMPAEGLSNGGLFEVKELEVTENGTYETKGEMYNKVTVNVEGGGGSSWQTVFEGSVTTTSEADETPWAELTEVADLSADTIKVTFNGVEYTCEKQSTMGGYSYGAPFGDDWSEYPFRIDINPRMSSIMTQTAGTYTLKIEEPQSGGSSDFSTANVVVDWSLTGFEKLVFDGCPSIVENFFTNDNTEMIIGQAFSNISPATIKVPLFDGGCFWEHSTAVWEVTGDIEIIDGEGFMITGDGTITCVPD